MTLSALGIFSAAGVSSGSTFELISTAFGTGSLGVIDFTSIPSTYKHLQIRFTAKNTSTATQINLTMNGITSSSYARHSLSGIGSAEASTTSTSLSSIQIPDSMVTTTTTGLASAGVIDILDYTSGTKNTTIRALYGQLINKDAIYITSGALFDTAVINRITFTAATDSFSSISRFSLYGIRG
jgi:hypothetical protein